MRFLRFAHHFTQAKRCHEGCGGETNDKTCDQTAATHIEVIGQENAYGDVQNQIAAKHNGHDNLDVLHASHHAYG